MFRAGFRGTVDTRSIPAQSLPGRCHLGTDAHVSTRRYLSSELQRVIYPLQFALSAISFLVFG